MGNCTIVVPCYNEAARLDVDAFKTFAEQGSPQRFLFVNDGSTDETLSVLKTLCDSDSRRFALHDLPRNVGKAEAVRQGILLALESNPDFVGFWDADLATPLSAIPQFRDFLEAKGQLQMVVGARVKLLGRDIRRRALRHYLGRVFATMASLALRIPIYDTQCGAKLFRASPEVRSLFQKPFRSTWIFDVELLARFLSGRRTAGLESAQEAIYEWPLDEWREVRGSKVKLRHFFRAFFELIVIYRTYGGRNVTKRQ